MKRVREKRQAEAQATVAKVIANTPNRSTPAPTAQPTTTQPSHTTATQASAPASQPPPPTAPKPRPVKKEPAGSPYPNTPENSRATVTPVPHPVVNQLQNQQPIRSPPVHARSPAPSNVSYQPHPPNAPIAAGSPAQRGYTQSPRPPSSQTPHPHSSPLAPGSQLPTPDHRANPSAVQFIQVAPGAAQSKPSTPQLGYATQAPPPPQQPTTQTHPQPAPAPPAPATQTQANITMQQYYAQMQQLQRMNHVAQAQAQAHVQAQTQAQVQGQIPTQMVQGTQHPAFPPQYNLAQYRPMTAQGNPHQQVAAHIPQNQQQNMVTQGQVMDGQQQMYVYGYPVNYGIAARGGLQAHQYVTAWAQAAGRIPNGQTPVMQAAHPQMPVAQGKAAQAGVQGR